MASVWFSSSVNVSEEERRRYLSILQEETTRMMIPAMFFLILLGVVGLVGNSLVLIVYSRNFQQTSTRIFIMAIAAFDLVTNVLAIPGEIYDMLHRWDFNQPHLCGFRLTLNAFTIVTSAFLLVAVAVVRCKKVCRPHGKQTTIKSAKFTTLAIMLAAIVCAIPCAILNGRQTKSTPRDDIKGDACTIDDRYVATIWPRAYMGIFIAGFLVCCTSLIVLYTLIGIQAWRHSNINRVISRVKSSAPSSTYQTTSEATSFDTETKSMKTIAGMKFSFLSSWRRQKDVKTRRMHTDNEIMTCAREETESTPVTFTDTNMTDKDHKDSDYVDTKCDLEMQPLGVGDGSREIVSNKSLTDKTPQHNPNSSNEMQARDCRETDIIVNGSRGQFTRSPQSEILDREILENGDRPDNEKNMGDQGVQVTHDNHEPDIRTTSDNIEGESKVDVSPSTRGQSMNLEATENGFRESPPIDDDKHDTQLCSDKFMKRKKVDFLPSDMTQKKMSDSIFHRKSSRFANDSMQEQNTPKHRRPMTRTTIMLTAISAVYVIGFLPHLSLVFFRYSSPRVFGEMSFAGFATYNLFLRFHFLNSASNAIIYNLCDKKFRGHAKRILKYMFLRR